MPLITFHIIVAVSVIPAVGVFVVDKIRKHTIEAA
jgi:hypothetical protein